MGQGHAWQAYVGARIALGDPGMPLQEFDRYVPWENLSWQPVLADRRR